MLNSRSYQELSPLCLFPCLLLRSRVTALVPAVMAAEERVLIANFVLIIPSAKPIPTATALAVAAPIPREPNIFTLRLR